MSHFYQLQKQKCENFAFPAFYQELARDDVIKIGFPYVTGMSKFIAKQQSA